MLWSLNYSGTNATSKRGLGDEAGPSKQGAVALKLSCLSEERGA